jgi:hypothetical protein
MVLRRREVWAIILGGIEMVILIITAITNLVSVGLSDMIGIYWLIILCFFLFALRREYNEIKTSRDRMYNKSINWTLARATNTRL